MFEQSRLFTLVIIILLNFITRCRALPLQQENGMPSTGITIFSIVLTIVIGYLAHVLTVRPQKPFGKLDANIFHLLLVIFPMSGIYMAILSIYSRYYGDKLLGIDQFRIPLEKYENRIRTKETHYSPPQPVPPPSPPLPPSLQSFSRISSIPSLSKESYKLEADRYLDHKKIPNPDDKLANAEQLRDWLVDYIKETDNIQFKNYDNAAYLAALLYTIGPKKARKVKDCIINNNLLLGFDSIKCSSFPDCGQQETKHISVNGPGVHSRYQSPVGVGLVRYLSIDMISQLQTAHNVDVVPYTGALVAIAQLFCVTIICVYDNGDRWARVPLFIYTAMSILQTVSLGLLHKQATPFSLQYDSDIPWKEIVEDHEVYTPKLASKMYLPKDTRVSNSWRDSRRDLLYKGSFLHFILEKCEFKNGSEDVITDRTHHLIAMFSILGGIVVPLLVCIWADYGNRSTAEALVFLWIISSVGANYVMVSSGNPTRIYSWLVILYLFAGFGCLIAGTVIGYLPK
ncbi:hypothetical protein CLU79DRAFT_739030 [Phycomyces nitens]|nr:hypothetical protein CLU79DRAFT_739030 [Phycomyces nitens]